jgi:putative membrane protein
VNWWCATQTEPWDWSSPTLYPGVWLFIATLGGLYAFAWRRRLKRTPGATLEVRRVVWFYLGLLILWIASDWPIGPLGAGYLATAHMAQYMLYTLGAAPLLVLGMPEWMTRRLLSKLRLYGAYRFLCKPLAAGILFNLILAATHAPVTVDALRTSQAGAFVLDMLWLFSGIIAWSPIVSPLQEVIPKAVSTRLVYLFIAMGVVPMIPGGFLTFAPAPLYGIFELAPRVALEPLDDQQAAGVLMKIGNLPVIWTVMAVMWAGWAEADRVESERERARMRRAKATAAGSASPLPPAP